MRNRKNIIQRFKPGGKKNDCEEGFFKNSEGQCVPIVPDFTETKDGMIYYSGKPYKKGRQDKKGQWTLIDPKTNQEFTTLNEVTVYADPTERKYAEFINSMRDQYESGLYPNITYNYLTGDIDNDNVEWRNYGRAQKSPYATWAEFERAAARRMKRENEGQQEQRREEIIQNAPTISQAGPKRPTWEKGLAIATHPLTAFGYSVRGQWDQMPDYFEKGDVNPFDRAIQATAALAGLRGVAPYLSAPAVIGSRTIPWLTGSNLLWGTGAYLSGDQLIDPNSATRTSINQAVENPTFDNVAGAIGNTGLTGLGFYGLPVRSGLLSLGDDFTRAGQYLTTQTPLRNAYKYNPWAFKTQKGKIYRQVGQAGFDDAITEGKIFDKGQKQFLEVNPKINYLDEYNEAINHSNSILKGLNLKKPSPAPFFSKDELFFPINRKATGAGNKKTRFSDAEYLFEGSVPEEALLPRYRDSYLKPTEATTDTFVLRPEYNDLSNFNLYKRDWLRGYKEIPTNASISKNIASKFQGLPEGVTTRDLQSVIQKNLDWVKSDEYISRRMASTGETRDQVIKTTDKWIKDLQKRTKYGMTEGTLDDPSGEYRIHFNPVFGRKSSVTVNSEVATNPEKFLNIFEHEFIHGLSPMAKPGQGHLYKNYPVLNVGADKPTLFQSLFGKPTTEQKTLRYLAEEGEQQARAVRLNNRIRQDLGIKDFRKITESEINKWFDEFYNPNVNKLNETGFTDVIDILDEAAASSGSNKNRGMFLDWINKAWATVPFVGAGTVLGATQEKKKGGKINYLRGYKK